MSDKDIKAGVSAGPTGIPTRSRLQPPTARALRPSGLAPPGGSVASSSQSRGNASTPGSSGARTTSISAPRKPSSAAAPSPIARKPSAPTLRTQTSNGKLKVPSSSKSPAAPIPSPKPPSRVTPSSRAVTTAPRSPKPPASSRKPAAPNPPPAQEPSPENGFSPSVGLSIKDQIAARRAAMKKAGVTSSTSSSGGSAGSRKASSTFSSSLKGGSGLGDWAEPALSEGPSEGADDIFGRATVRETIMKAMHTGNLNLMSRQLTALPTSLFTLHLGITPAPLSGSSGETMPDDDAPTGIHRWEAMDLTVLKVGDNEIAELHEEIVLFGALKNVDLHKNKLSTLPASFGELVSLTHLDISHCSFTSLPSILSTLPALVSLNVSHNSLSSLNLAFPPADAQSESRLSQFRDAPLYSTPEIQKAGRPFEALQTLLLCGNKLTAAAIEPLENLPRSLVKLDVDKNPLVNSGAGGVISLLSALAMLPALKELQMRSAGLEDLTLADFPSPTSSTSSFPRLEALDVGDNDWLTEACVRRSLLASRPAESIQVGTHMDVLRAAASSSSPASVKLVIGKHVVKEAWELELERRQPGRKAAVASAPSNGTHDEKPNAVAAKAGDDDEWGLPGFGKKEVRVRRNAAASGRALPSQAYGREPEEEISLPTTNTQASKDDSTLSTDAKESSAPTTPDVAAGGLKSPLDKYFDSRTRTLTLPSAIPQRGRGFGAGHAQDMAVPQQTFPHATIISHHAWVRDLRTLVLSNRRVDAGFLLAAALAGSGGGSEGFLLPDVEELQLDGCNLQSRVKVSYKHVELSSPDDIRELPNPTVPVPEGENLPLIPLLHRIFPGLATLDLSYNALTTLDGVREMFLPTSPSLLGETGAEKVLKVLRVKGNKLDEAALNDLAKIGQDMKEDGDNGIKERWKGLELDLRENEIGKLPGALGWLPLDVLLVESNAFRVPNRRVWERDGTKGLQAFLKAMAD